MTYINNFPNWRLKLGIILDFLIVFEIILNTHSVYYFALDRDYYTLFVLAGLLCVHLVIVPTVFQKEQLKRFMIFAVAWAAYIGVYALVSGGNLKLLLSKFYILLVLFAAYFYGHHLRGSIKQLFKHYVDIMFVLALISIFMWVGGSVLEYFPSTAFHVEWGSDRYIRNFHYIYFHYQNDFWVHGHRFFRNIGIFTEAPMHSLHLCTALMFDLLINENKTKFRWFRIIWFCGTILTTFSTTGYLFMMMLIVFDLYATLITRVRSSNEVIAAKAKKQLIAVTGLGFVFGIFGLSLVVDKLATRSGGSRTEDYIIGFKGWRDNVWFGSGYGNIESRLKYASWRRQHRSSTGYTNSPLAVLNEGGIWFFMSYYLSFVYGFVVSWQKKDWRMVAATFLVMILFITTTFEHTAYIIAFIAFMISHALAGSYKKDVPMIGSKIQ